MTSRSFRMWINDFSKYNKENIDMQRSKDKNFKMGDKINSPMGDGIFVSYDEKTDECTVQMYSDNRTVRLKKALIRKV